MTKNLSEELQRNARQALAGLTPVPSGDETGGLPVRRLLAAFFRARYLVAGTTLFGVLVGVFLAITTPNNYVSTGQFSFSSLGAETRQLDPTQAKETSQEAIATSAAYILSSDDLLRRVVDRLGPERILQPYQPGGAGYAAAKELFFKIQRDWNRVDPAQMTPDEALKHLQKTVAVERPRFANVLVATCDANNPELAQEILATYMDEAVKWHIEKYESKKAYDGAQQAYEDARAAHEVAQREMRDFLDNRARVSDFEMHLEGVELDEQRARSRLTGDREDLQIKSKQLELLEQQIGDPERLPPTRVRMVAETVESEVLAQFRERLGNAYLKLGELKVLLSDPEHAEIKAQQKQIEQIEQSIREVRGREREGRMVERVEDNPQYVRAVEDRDKLQIDLVGLEARVKLAGELHAEKERELKRLIDLSGRYEELRAAVQRAEENRRQSQVTFELAEQKRALGVGNFSSLIPIQQASMPLEKEGPNRVRLLAAGLFVGLFFGLGLVVLRALPDSVVRTRDDLEDIDGLSVIGVVPKLDRSNLRRHMAMREQGW